MKSIKTRMMVFFSAILLVVCAGLGIASYINASNALINNVEETLPQIAAQSANVVNERVKGVLDSLGAVASIDKIVDQGTAWEDKATVLNEEVKRSGHMKMGIADKNGDIVYTNGQAISIKDRDYFQKALAGENAVSDPILSKAENAMVIVYAVPIKNDGMIVGVLVATRDGNDLSSITDDITFGKTGKAFMINKTGNTIAHSNKELVINMDNDLENVKKDPELQSLVDLEKKMMAGEKGSGEYEYNGVVKYLGYAPVGNTGWSIAVAAPKDEVFAEMQNMRNMIIILSIAFVLIALVIVFFISKSLSKGVKAASNGLNVLAKGDFTHDMPAEYLDRKDEIGSIARSLKDMKDSIGSMISAVRESAGSIDVQSENLSAVSEEMSSSAENVTNAIQDVAKGTGTQAEELVEVSGILSNFGDELDSIVKSIREIGTNSRDINSMASESSEGMAKLSESVNRISSAFKEFTDKIKGLGQSVNRINEITGLINSIADQTNLLALNASIEAARAGEAGRGFAVVADEIRKLAEQAKASSENINNLVGGISTETTEMLKTTDIMSGELNSQVSVINTAVSSFGRIIGAIDVVAPKIESVNTSATALDSEKNTIIEKIEGVSSIAEEVSASSEEIAASSEEMSASTQEVASSAQALSGMTRDLMDQVKKFKLQ